MKLAGATLILLLAACASAGGESAPAPAPTAAPTQAPKPVAAPASAAPAPSAQSADTRPPGQRLYARHCLTCHQADGYGVPNMQPAITGGSWVKGEAQPLALFVLTGGFNSAERKDSESHNVMPAFRQLSDEDLAAILSYIREKFGDGAPPVSVTDVAAARATLPATP